MVLTSDKSVEYLVVDTTAFLQNAQLQNVAENIVTCREVVDEIQNKRQLRRLVVLPYDLVIKDVFPENIRIITEFSKKTGDYPSLSATDIKVMALTYQLEKEKVGVDHLRTEPLSRPAVNYTTKSHAPDISADFSGFYLPNRKKTASKEKENKQETVSESENVPNEPVITDEELQEKFAKLECEDLDTINDSEDILVPAKSASESEEEEESEDEEETDDDDGNGWITPSNVATAKKQVNSELMEAKHVIVACMTTDFAMQNVLRQMNLNVSALDGRMIKQLRTYILRCYTCLKTTSIMTKKFCPKCGNNTLKRVSVSVDENGKMQIYINTRRPLSGRGKKFSLPTIKGGKHSNNPRLVEDQPMPDQRPTRLARTKNNPLDDDYIAGYSPFVMRDVNSKSAQLCIRPGAEMKHWMRKNPNEARRKRK